MVGQILPGQAREQAGGLTGLELGGISDFVGRRRIENTTVSLVEWGGSAGCVCDGVGT